jgi:hypothetical protein
MKENLIQKIGHKTLKIGFPLILGGLGLIVTGCGKEYNLNESNVIDYRKTLFAPALSISLKEIKTDSIIKYFSDGPLLYKMKINKETYKMPNDSSKLKIYQERYNSLKNKVDSIKTARDEELIWQKAVGAKKGILD